MKKNDSLDKAHRLATITSKGLSSKAVLGGRPHRLIMDKHTKIVYISAVIDFVLQ